MKALMSEVGLQARGEGEGTERESRVGDEKKSMEGRGV
jgi:hypothetical protein